MACPEKITSHYKELARVPFFDLRHRKLDFLLNAKFGNLKNLTKTMEFKYAILFVLLERFSTLTFSFVAHSENSVFIGEKGEKWGHKSG